MKHGEIVLRSGEKRLAGRQREWIYQGTLCMYGKYQNKTPL
jgi:hypothetical protein